MSESTTARTSSSLAITEIKANNRRPGGCVGIFFQLFDWNRRFSKKKIFPKKLLPPARAKVSKKFNADEKLPVGKHLLIAADENNGGFPSNVKKNADHRLSLEQKKHQMQAPGLVARLMGLEAMPVPVVSQDNSNKGSPRDDKADSSPEKGNLRPQKLQKTGVLERRPVTRFGAEALQIKNVLSRSRKHHHQKLASPVKSPKLGRNTSRLIDAAARILEPSIQARSRARCSLSYSNSIIQPSKEDVKADMDLQCQSSSTFIDSQPLNAQSSCRSCGNLLEHLEMRPVAEEQFREAFSCGLEERRPRPAVYLKNETEVVLLKTRYQPDCMTTGVEENRSVDDQSQYHNQIPASRMFTSQKNTSPSHTFKQRNQRHSQMLNGDRVPPRSKLVAETKDFIALNRNISRSRVRVPSKSENNTEPDRRFCAGKNDSLATPRSPVRKRRTLNVSRPVDTAGSASSFLEKQRSNRGNVMTRNGSRIRANSLNQSYIKSRPATQRGSRETDVVSFTFNSPVKSKDVTFFHNEMDVKTRDQIGQFSDESLLDKTMMEENGMKRLSENSLHMSGDALGALLEQKLKELTHQVENEAASGFMPSAKTTASILQELISALTVEKPISYDDEAHGPDTLDSQASGDNVDRISQSKSRIKRSSDNISCKADHFSPGCVLDASFSNESCISSSIDDSSGHMLQSDYMDLSCDTVQPACTDADLSDSASCTNKTRRSNLILITDLLNHTSAALQNVDLVHAKLTGTKLDYVQEIVFNAELLFGNGGLHGSSSYLEFLLGPFLDELETLVIAAWKNTVILGLEVRKEENPVRRFLLDCIIECLDVNYSRYSNSGYRAWSRLPKCMNTDILVKLFDGEVRKWITFAGKAPDEIIEREMSTSLGKWTDFEIEAFETASQINQELVQSLVDEIVVELVGSELSFC